MLFFTWNMNRSEKAFDLALSYLSRTGGDFIAAFQELPCSAASTSAAEHAVFALVKDRVRCLGVVGSSRESARVGLFSSPNLKAERTVEADPRQRMAMASLRSAHWTGLNVIGIHAVDRRNHASEHARDVHSTNARENIDAFWSMGHPLVVLGDFNADPYESEVSSRLGFFAIRDSKDVLIDWPHPMEMKGAMKRPLYNPVWTLLPESKSGPGGTYMLNSMDRGIRWRILDQILVSRELMDRIEGPPEILAEIDKKALLTKAGHPSRKHMSDHLPLQMRIRI